MQITLPKLKVLHKQLGVTQVKLSHIGIREAIGLFRNLEPTQPVRVTTLTQAWEVAKSGTPLPYRDCLAVKHREVRLNNQYEDSVNTQRKAEHHRADFEAFNHSWGTSIGPPFLVGGKEGHLYLSLEVLDTLNTQFVTPKLEPLLYDEVAQYFLPPKKSTRQKLANEVQYRNYDITSILAVCVGPTGYVITP